MEFDQFKRNLDTLIDEGDLASLANATFTTSSKASGKCYDVLKSRVDYTSEIQHEKDARKRLAELEKKYEDNHDLSGLESELKELDRKVAHLQHKEENLSEDCKELIASTSISDRDAKILNTLKKKFTLYKEVTGLKWDFTCPENEIRGFVRNKLAGTTQYFNLTGKPREEVWELLKSASHADWNEIEDSEGKENCGKGNSN